MLACGVVEVRFRRPCEVISVVKASMVKRRAGVLEQEHSSIHPNTNCNHSGDVCSGDPGSSIWGRQAHECGAWRCVAECGGLLLLV
jgi:hypothetical protein